MPTPMPALLLLLAALIPAAAPAGPARVVAAEATRSGDVWRFDVTLAHADEGWEHYADAWAVRTPAGETLGTRELLHPHVTEQPFTRSLPGVAVPPGLAEVLIVPRDSVHGWGDPFRLALPR